MVEVVQPQPGEQQGRKGPSGKQALTQPCLLFSGRLIALEGHTEFIIGRADRSCDLVIPDARISRRHAAIMLRGGRFMIRDLGSMNGTFINGERVSGSYGLVPGDEVTLPPHKMLFVLAGMEGTTKEQVVGVSPAIQPKGHFSGLLHALGVADLIQLLNSTLQSGMLTVKDVGQRAGKLILIQGEVAEAEFGDLKGEEAVYAMLSLTEGDFEFAQGTPTPPKSPISRKTVSLLLEGLRLFDEKRSKTQSIPITYG